ncbi:hypothetical protein D3P07_04405 [Paenibacillus sp. 1011MAR3C5]|nr:hypothetical protein D3P07_04405 [Paenibacillus sp. 1011MAR3C5]
MRISEHETALCGVDPAKGYLACRMRIAGASLCCDLEPVEFRHGLIEGRSERHVSCSAKRLYAENWNQIDGTAYAEAVRNEAGQKQVPRADVFDSPPVII